MKEIKGGKKTRKTSARKIFSIIGIAAAITAVLTVTAQAATGVFNPAFGEFFAGQPANGVFPGADLSRILSTVSGIGIYRNREKNYDPC